ncbi:hypothetical protein F4820DRAFT_402284 [Hypoxylon rubiginosum]|uniref:Uncharacterized protein n=1 Tax=Hypoxylon rubiginosum TaxID=110542 RepID=A0ACB9ZIC8_9PEZI|nr:hypothetical protein F4820DRAFT_402284 [Hypoxylon rubiginosum]
MPTRSTYASLLATFLGIALPACSPDTSVSLEFPETRSSHMTPPHPCLSTIISSLCLLKSYHRPRHDRSCEHHTQHRKFLQIMVCGTSGNPSEW